VDKGLTPNSCWGVKDEGRIFGPSALGSTLAELSPVAAGVPSLCATSAPRVADVAGWDWDLQMT